MVNDLLETAYRSTFRLSPTVEVHETPIKKGASGRTIVRLSTLNGDEEGGGEPVIGIQYTHERADNALHKPVSDFLEQAGVRVPSILYADLVKNVLLVQDIGTIDLLSYKDEPWSIREPLYRETFRQLVSIARTQPTSEVEMMPPFTEETYLWEQSYFAEHYIGTHLGGDSVAFQEHPLMCTLAAELGSRQPDLTHRDFQSQNLMVKNGEIYVIDFQGARPGYVEYDLASFIYDPYMKHPIAEREALRTLWEEESTSTLDAELLRKCALQRLMQALGAYGNIVYNQKDAWYAQHIPPAVDMLRSLTVDTQYEELFHPLLKA